MSQPHNTGHPTAPEPPGQNPPSTSNASVPVAPPPRLLSAGTWQHGRFYGTWRPGKYLFPIDLEESNRLDIFHKFFIEVREMELFSNPLPTTRPPKVLDLGTGTGIWAINVADSYGEAAEVMAVDLNQTQPALIPPTMMTLQFDIEDDDWSPLLINCDLIHLRMMLGTIEDNIWPSTYRNIYDHLRPDEGYLEQVEIDWNPQWEGTDVPESSDVKRWSEILLKGLDRFGRSARLNPDQIRAKMEAAGLVDVTEKRLRVYLNPWSPNKHERNVARWFNLGLTLGLEAMSLMPMIEKLGMTKDEVRQLCERVRSEACVLKYHAYFTVYVWTARRPKVP